MLEVIICSCGKNLGCLVDLYDYCYEIIKKNAIAKDLKNVQTQIIPWDNKWDIQTGKLMDILQLKLPCCRMNMLSKIKVKQLQL